VHAVFVVTDDSVETADCGPDFLQCDRVGVAFVLARHVGERVEGYGTLEGDAGFEAPVPFVLLHCRMIIKFPGRTSVFR